jgi:hypothetical protein
VSLPSVLPRRSLRGSRRRKRAPTPASGCRRAPSGGWGRTGRPTAAARACLSLARAAAASRRAGPSTWWITCTSGWPDWVPRSTACGTWGTGVSPTGDDQCLAGAEATGEPGALLRGGSFVSGSLAGPLAVLGSARPFAPGREHRLPLRPLVTPSNKPKRKGHATLTDASRKVLVRVASTREVSLRDTPYARSPRRRTTGRLRPRRGSPGLKGIAEIASGRGLPARIDRRKLRRRRWPVTGWQPDQPDVWTCDAFG